MILGKKTVGRKFLERFRKIMEVKAFFSMMR